MSRRAGLGAVCVALLAVAACTSHSDRSARSVTTTLPVPSAVLRSPRTVVAEASCPPRQPAAPANGPEAAHSLLIVAVVAVAIRVCRYDGASGVAGTLAATGSLVDRRRVAPLETMTNRLPATSGATTRSCSPVTGSSLYVTFADAQGRSVDLLHDDRCGTVTNGSVAKQDTIQWRTALSSLAQDAPGATLALPTETAGGQRSVSALRGELASDGVCFWIRSQSGARTNVIWPSGYRAHTLPLRVLDESGRAVGRVGDALALPGRRVPVTRELVAPLAPPARRCLPAPCPAAGPCRADVWTVDGPVTRG